MAGMTHTLDPTPCPTWCEGAHDPGGDHFRDVFSGPGPGGTAHIDMIQPEGEPIQVQVSLEYDDAEYLDADEAAPEPSTESYTALAAHALAGFARLGEDLGEFADALVEAANLVDAHQDPSVEVPHVPVPVPTRVWLSVLEVDDLGLPRGWA